MCMKKTYSFRIDEEVMYRLKQFVLSKHGRIYEVLGEEVTTAILNHIDRETSTHTYAHTQSFPLRSYQKLDIIITWLRENGYTKQFHIKDWILACSNTVGADNRTIRKYLKLAESFGKVKHIVGNIYELI